MGADEPTLYGAIGSVLLLPIPMESMVQMSWDVITQKISYVLVFGVTQSSGVNGQKYNVLPKFVKHEALVNIRTGTWYLE